MAFSYSDKNFTVIGNLCFAHIDVKNKNANYFIPDAIADRMLIKTFVCPYVAYGENENGDTVFEISNVIINNYSIFCRAKYDNGYLFFYFPIDSNK